MTNEIADISPRTAARIVGIGLIIMFFLAIFAILIVLSNIIVPGDAATTANNIKANELLFGIAIVGYYIILALDVAVALALYVILKPVNKNLSLLAAILRLVYTAIMIISLLALIFLFINAYSCGELIAYIFFIPHLFVLGYIVFKSGYIPRILGVLLIIGSFCYIITIYGHLFISKELYELLLIIVFLPEVLAEMSLAFWLLLKANKLSEMIEEKMNTSGE
jgi:hypothetical protein